MFIRALLSLREDDPSRLIFCARTEDYMSNLMKGKENICNSVIFDLLNVADTFGMLGEVVNMARIGHIWSKCEWKKTVWKRARELGNACGESKSNVILVWICCIAFVGLLNI